MAQRYFAVTSPGLEHALRSELRSMRVKRLEQTHGGVEFDATGRGLYQVMHCSRVASRVYLRVDEFRARDVHELFRKSKRVEWQRLIPQGAYVSFDTTTQSSHLAGTGEISKKVLEGMRAQFNEANLRVPREAPDVAGAQLRLVVRMRENRCLLSLDAAGQTMHRRGWRKGSARAPLRENIASALLHLLGWRPGDALMDPMCGTGTFLIEAARMCAHLPPRLWGNSAYGFMSWANFDRDMWQAIIAEQSEGATIKASSGLLLGMDRDQEMLDASTQNAHRAGVHELISWHRGDVRHLAPLSDVDRPGFVIANPPFGARISRKKAGGAADRKLIEQFQEEQFRGWTLGVLMPSDVSWPLGDLNHEPLVRFKHGGIPVTFHRITHPS